MAIAQTYVSGVTAVENLAQASAPDVAVANVNITHDQFNTNKTLNAGSTPPVSVYAGWSPALSAGAVTIDLTNMTGTNGATVSANALTPRVIKFANPGTNANAITIAKGATNGYTGLGASFSITLQPGQESTHYLAANGTAVSATVKTFDLTGTGTQALNVSISAG